MSDLAAWRIEPARADDAAALALLSRDLIESGLHWRWRTAQVADLIARADTTVLVTRLPHVRRGSRDPAPACAAPARQRAAASIPVPGATAIEGGAAPALHAAPGFAGVDDPTPVGFGALAVEHGTAHLLLLAVAGAHQRRGLGHALLTRLEQVARAAGAVRVHLEVRAANLGARAFYRRHGFYEHVYVEDYYDGVEAALRMHRRLDDDPLTLLPPRAG